MTDRIIVLVDMDCFYVQVEQRLQPQYFGKPCAVVQYNTWKGGGIIAVNYEARHFGVTRGMRGDLAKQKCPDIHLFQVPEVRGKADLTRYRDAGAEVIDVVSTFSDCVERASIDEAYLDMTKVIASKLGTEVLIEQLPQTSVVGWDDGVNNSVSPWLESIKECGTISDTNLAIVSIIVEEMRTAVFSKTKFRCSAGISHNKMLAKLACGLHKPNHQTILPQTSVLQLFKSVSIHKLRNLGGKLGEDIKEKLEIETMFELSLQSEKKLKNLFGDKTGIWLYNVARGIENEPVTARQLPKSIGCGKNFPGKAALNTKVKVRSWLQKLTEELEERLTRDQENNKRFAKVMTVSLRFQNDDKYTSVARSLHIKSYDAITMTHDLYNLLEKMNKTSPSSHLWTPPIVNLSLSAGKFQDNLDVDMPKIHDYFSLNGKSPVKSNRLNHNNESPIEKLKQLYNSFNKNSNEDKPSSHPKSSINNYFQIRNRTGECSNMENSINVSKSNEFSTMQNFDKLSVINNSKKGFFAAKMKQAEEKKKESGSLKTYSIKQNKCEEIKNQNDQTESEFSDKEELINNCIKNADLHSEDEGLKLFQLTPSDENLLLSEDISSKCQRCDQLIPVWKVQEHEDYHYAISLQKELKNISTSHTEQLSKTQLPSKRKASPNKKKIIKKQKDSLKTIDKFFKKD